MTNTEEGMASIAAEIIRLRACVRAAAELRAHGLVPAVEGYVESGLISNEVAIEHIDKALALVTLPDDEEKSE